MRPEIIHVLTYIVNEDVMSALIKRQDFYGLCELLMYVDMLDEYHRARWINLHNKLFSLS